MIKKEAIEINESNKLTLLNYTNSLITGLNFSDPNNNIITINKFNFLKKVQEFPLEPDKFIITSDIQTIKNNNINDSIYFSEKGFFENLKVLISYVIDNSDSCKEKMQLLKKIYPQTQITSFIIQTILEKKTIFELSFKNISPEESKEIWDWFCQITKEANKIILLQNKCLEQSKDTNNSNQIIYSRNNKTPVNSKLTPESIKDTNNSNYNEIKELINKINSPTKFQALCYVIKNKLFNEYSYQNKNYDQIIGEISFLLQKIVKRKDPDDHPDRTHLLEAQEKINLISEESVLIEIFKSAVIKASTILAIVKQDTKSIKFGDVLEFMKPKDPSKDEKQSVKMKMNNVLDIIYSYKEYFFKKPEEITDNNKRTSEKNECTSKKNECTSKKRINDESSNHYEDNNKKLKNDIDHEINNKNSVEKNQLREYSKRQFNKKYNIETNNNIETNKLPCSQVTYINSDRDPRLRKHIIKY